jgi:hypothetical protein
MERHGSLVDDCYAINKWKDGVEVQKVARMENQIEVFECNFGGSYIALNEMSCIYCFDYFPERTKAKWVSY